MLVNIKFNDGMLKLDCTEISFKPIYWNKKKTSQYNMVLVTPSSCYTITVPENVATKMFENDNNIYKIVLKENYINEESDSLKIAEILGELKKIGKKLKNW